MTEFKCAHCAAVLNGHMNPSDAKPAPEVDDVTVCCECSGLMYYAAAEDGSIVLLPMTQEYMDRMEDDLLIELHMMQKAVKERLILIKNNALPSQRPPTPV